MRRHDAYVRLIRSTVVVFAIGFAWSSFALAEEPPPSLPPVQDEPTTPAETPTSDVQGRGFSIGKALGGLNKTVAPIVVAPIVPVPRGIEGEQPEHSTVERQTEPGMLEGGTPPPKAP
jgi:hypothetical protein